MKHLKGFKKLLALTASAVMLAFLPNGNALTVSAEEPTTYYVKYSDSDEDWRYQLGSSWDDSAESTPSHYMHENIKNGDIVIIGNGSPSMLTLNVRLSNLTICNTTDTLAMVSVTGGIDHCDFVSGSFASVTGNVTNAHVHGGATANFNSNVSNLYSHKYDSEVGPNIGVTGTVSYFRAEDLYEDTVPYTGTNFAADSFSLENGVLTTDASKYTNNGSGGPVSPAAPTAAPATPQPTKAPAASGPSQPSDEYDKVPKTGETSAMAWLTLTAAACLGMGLLLRKTAK